MSSTNPVPFEQAISDPEKADGDPLSHTRREAVRRLGKYAAYTAPALTADTVFAGLPLPGTGGSLASAA